MRSVKELLEVMLEHQDKFGEGLCGWSFNLHYRGLITNGEFQLLLEYITYNRPSKFSSLLAFKNRKNCFYWERGEIAPRIKWIKKHINKLK